MCLSVLPIYLYTGVPHAFLAPKELIKVHVSDKNCICDPRQQQVCLSTKPNLQPRNSLSNQVMLDLKKVILVPVRFNFSSLK